MITTATECIQKHEILIRWNRAVHDERKREGQTLYCNTELPKASIANLRRNMVAHNCRGSKGSCFLQLEAQFASARVSRRHYDRHQIQPPEPGVSSAHCPYSEGELLYST